MNIEDLKDIFDAGKNALNDPYAYKDIINMKLGMLRIDSINRIIAYKQNNNITDLRTEFEWEILGRSIRKGQKPIYVIMPKNTYKYIDTETGRQLDDGELTIDELNKALEYNIVSRVHTMEGTNVQAVFDIKQTKGNNSKYKVDKVIVNSSYILDILKNNFDITIELSDDTYYSESRKMLYIKKQTLTELIYTFSNIVIPIYIDSVNKDIGVNTYEYSEYEKEILNNTLIYGIYTLLGKEITLSFDNVRFISKERLIEILNIQYIIVSNIAQLMKFNTGEKPMSISHSLEIHKKAEAILDIMEANNISKIMKGA